MNGRQALAYVRSRHTIGDYDWGRDGRQQEVRVVVGLDEASPAMQDLVLIGAPARLGANNMGTVAVIAPTRIQYQEMIQAVRYIAGLSERLLEVPAD